VRRSAALPVAGTVLATVGLACLAYEVARTLDGGVLGTFGTVLLWLGVGLLAVGLLLLVLSVVAESADGELDTSATGAAWAEPAHPVTPPAPSGATPVAVAPPGPAPAPARATPAAAEPAAPVAPAPVPPAPVPPAPVPPAQAPGTVAAPQPATPVADDGEAAQADEFDLPAADPVTATPAGPVESAQPGDYAQPGASAAPAAAAPADRTDDSAG
jgi:hypothetical protein